MEPAFRSRPTAAAADDEENGRLRRFPEPPPPQRHGHGDANISGVDAALLTRRQELLLELHKGFMHQDMILRELMETQRAIGLTACGYNHNPVSTLPWSQDYWHCRTPSVPPWEAPLHQSCPCSCRSSIAVRVPPLYPHVERSPSPALSIQLQSASDIEKQQDYRPSGARTLRTSHHVELCSSPSKCALEEETLVPVAPNASVRSMHSGSIHEEVASTHQRADDSCEHKGGAEACHGVRHMYEGRNQKSKEREAAKFAKGCQSDEAMQLPYHSLAGNENAGSYQQKHLESSEHPPEQTRPGSDAEQHQEGRSFSVLRTHPFSGYVELCRSLSKQTPVEETLVPVAAKAGINQMQSASFCEAAASGHQHVGVKVEVEDGHMQPLHEIKNQRREKGKAAETAINDCMKKPVQQRLQYMTTDQGNTTNSDQKSTEFNEPTHEGTSAGVKRKLIAPSSPVKKQKPLGQWSCTVCHANLANQDQLGEHLAGKRHGSNVAALQKSRSKSKSNSPEPNTKATPARSKITATNAHQDGKEEVPENTWMCTLCQAKCTNEWNYYIHLNGREHKENADARRVKLLRSYCTVCDLQCNSEKNLASHLGGRRHREALESRGLDAGALAAD